MDHVCLLEDEELWDRLQKEKEEQIKNNNNKIPKKWAYTPTRHEFEIRKEESLMERLYRQYMFVNDAIFKIAAEDNRRISSSGIFIKKRKWTDEQKKNVLVSSAQMKLITKLHQIQYRYEQLCYDLRELDKLDYLDPLSVQKASAYNYSFLEMPKNILMLSMNKHVKI